LTDKKFEEYKDSLILNFEGKDEIDVETFSQSIYGVIRLIKITTSLHYPDSKVKLNIINFKKGSIEIDLSALIQLAPAVLPILNATLSLINISFEYIKIKKHLKGEKPKDVVYNQNNNQAKIINQYNETFQEDAQITKNYFNHCTIDNSIINIFFPLFNDNDRAGLKIIQNNETKIDISKDEFSNMTISIVESVDNDKKLLNRIDYIELPLKKPDLLGKSTWSFKYKENTKDKTIDARIEDEQFIEEVHQGKIKNLYAGVKVPVQMRIEQDIDENKIPLKDTERYIIEKIKGKIIEPEDKQMEIDFK
jgi:hypothetical protein